MMSRRFARRIAGVINHVGWLAYSGPLRPKDRPVRFAYYKDGWRWRWFGAWESLSLAWGRFWNRRLASAEEHVE